MARDLDRVDASPATVAAFLDQWDGLIAEKRARLDAAAGAEVISRLRQRARPPVMAEVVSLKVRRPRRVQLGLPL